MEKNFTDVGALIKKYASRGFQYVPETGKNGKPTRRARRFTCPVCKEKLLQAGKSERLAQIGSLWTIIFWDPNTKAMLAVCANCGFKKSEVSPKASEKPKATGKKPRTTNKRKVLVPPVGQAVQVTSM